VSPFTGIVAQEYTFETGAGKWWPMGNIKYTQATDIKHSGTSSLNVSGTSPVEKWNYIQSNDFNIDPGKRYKLSGWMLVKSISNTKYAPMLKCGVNQNSKWLANFNTKKYDLNKKVSGRSLPLSSQRPRVKPQRVLLKSKKGTSEAIEAEIFIDDLKLEVGQ